MTAKQQQEALDCTLRTEQKGEKLVLFSPGDGLLYRLDDQEKARQFVGRRVELTGTYDVVAHIIQVQEIQMVERRPLPTKVTSHYEENRSQAGTGD